MRLYRSARWLLLALLVSLAIPAVSHAGVLISVAVAPPPLVAYDQPPCPQDGWMWTPGYWAYDYNNGGYYWVPGTWVPAPYEGALWTPGYWGFETGVYLWHPGYWGRHVGYYGGVDYGFGYMGIGFVGGEWRGHGFAYNTAAMHVNRSVIHNVYEDRTIVQRDTIVNDRHVAYAGGPGGIHHPPTPEERQAEREQHMQPTSFQQQHVQAAVHDRAAYYNSNHGRPATVAAQRPMTAPAGRGPVNNGAMNRGGRPNGANSTQPMYKDNHTSGQNPLYEGGRDQTARPNNQGGQQHAAPGMAVKSQGVPEHYKTSPNSGAVAPHNAGGASRPQPEARPAPQPRPQQREEQPREKPRDEKGR